MEVYLGVLDKTAEQVEEELHPQAELIIKRRLVLEAIAEAEALEVSDDEIIEVIKHDAEALGRDHLQLLADLEKSGRREAVRDEMLLAKTVDFVADAVRAGADDRGRGRGRRGGRGGCGRRTSPTTPTGELNVSRAGKTREDRIGTDA